MREMAFLDLNKGEKRRLFEFIAHLAILAGQEMSEEGYAHYNDVIIAFLNNAGLLNDFMATASDAELSSPPSIGGTS